MVRRGPKVWNTWRQHGQIGLPDLTNAQLSRASLHRANLSSADLREVDLTWADLSNTDMRRADLRDADLREVDLRDADLSEADMRGSNLRGANLSRADLSKADLSGSNLQRALLVETQLEQANLQGCCIYGISAWNVRLDEETQQRDLVITRDDEPAITVDNLEVAQFIYLLLNNRRVREVIDTISSKMVLILGRFTPDRKAVLDGLREELRHHDYLPVLFDFEKPASRDLTETVQTLAGMARFVIVDLTDAQSVPQELSLVVPNLPSVPVQPLVLAGASEYAMFEHWRRFPWVLPEYRYECKDGLLATLLDDVITQIEAKVAELRNTTRSA
jgi:hypothetical protein